MDTIAANRSAVSSSNPVLAKLRTIPKDSRRDWVRGFLDQVDRVYFASWTVAEADEAKAVLLRWSAVYRPSTSTAALAPESSLSPESILGYARSFLFGRDPADFQAEAASFLEALEDAEGYSEDEMRRATRVLTRLALFK